MLGHHYVTQENKNDANHQSLAAVGSKSTITQRGTCFPAPVSEKNLHVFVLGATGRTMVFVEVGS